MWFSSGVVSNATRICVPPVKSTPFGIPCQNSMLSIPATEKISENPRKYHFFPSQSILVLRKNSTFAILITSKTCHSERSEEPPHFANAATTSNRKRRAALLVLQVRVKDHARDKHRRKQVCQQTERQRHRETTHRAGSEEEQDHRRDDCRHVGVDNGHPGVREALLHRNRG